MKMNMLTMVILTITITNGVQAGIKERVKKKEQKKATIANKSNSCFVKYADGSIRKFNTLELVNGFLSSPHLLADNKHIIMPADIIEYRTADYYAVSQKLIQGCRKSNVSKFTLPGFALRLISGPINVYQKTYFDGAVAIDGYFIQAGNDSKIYEYNIPRMLELLRHQPEASRYFITDDNNNAYLRLKHLVDMMSDGIVSAR